MKPKYISFDAAFEKQFDKYKKRLTGAERNRLRTRIEIFSAVFCSWGILFMAGTGERDDNSAEV